MAAEVLVAADLGADSAVGCRQQVGHAESQKLCSLMTRLVPSLGGVLGGRLQAADQQYINKSDQSDGSQRHREQRYHTIRASASAAGSNRDQVDRMK